MWLSKTCGSRKRGRGTYDKRNAKPKNVAFYGIYWIFALLILDFNHVVEVLRFYSSINLILLYLKTKETETKRFQHKATAETTKIISAGAVYQRKVVFSLIQQIKHAREMESERGGAKKTNMKLKPHQFCKVIYKN